MDSITLLPEQIASFGAFSISVNEMKVGQRYEMPSPFIYSFICINNRGAGIYSWTIQRRGNPGYVFPMASVSKVKFFKTEAGAKRNLIKYCARIFKNK